MTWRPELTRPFDPLAELRWLDERAVLAAERELEAREEVAALLSWLEQRVAIAPGWIGGRMLARVARRRLEGASLERIGRELGRSTERVRQMYGEACRRMRERRPARGL